MSKTCITHKIHLFQDYYGQTPAQNKLFSVIEDSFYAPRQGDSVSANTFSSRLGSIDISDVDRDDGVDRVDRVSGKAPKYESQVTISHIQVSISNPITAITGLHSIQSWPGEGSRVSLQN